MEKGNISLRGISYDTSSLQPIQHIKQLTYTNIDKESIECC